MTKIDAFMIGIIDMVLFFAIFHLTGIFKSLSFFAVLLIVTAKFIYEVLIVRYLMR